MGCLFFVVIFYSYWFSQQDCWCECSSLCTTVVMDRFSLLIKLTGYLDSSAVYWCSLPISNGDITMQHITLLLETLTDEEWVMFIL